MVRVSGKQPFRSEARRSEELEEALKKLGASIARLRAKGGMTQEQLAVRASIDVKHLQDAEHGRSNLTVASLLGIARGLDVKIAEIFADV